jgi:hypothetical protein
MPSNIGPSQQRQRSRADRLPDIGDEGRHHQERCGLRRCHHHGKQPHRDSGQADADDTLHETRKHERQCDEIEIAYVHAPYIAATTRASSSKVANAGFVEYDGTGRLGRVLHETQRPRGR